ncbi:hypothetical protein VNI00_015460 [Paramarasmius palmivorus]|uniref:endo-polygalacturonase n=1 Tax=Paramarasmius palmivorus TaxID=297713 RepID=A0AAW0BKP1_9AGAR
MNGNITFGVSNWAGPLFLVSGKDITFNGNGYTFDGNGPAYWDGKGLNNGTTKPAPMMKIKISGIYQEVVVLNSPARAYSVDSSAPLLMTSLTVDNSAGDKPNNNTDGKAAGHNTDGFDVSASNLVISNSNVHNQVTTPVLLVNFLSAQYTVPRMTVWLLIKVPMSPLLATPAPEVMVSQSQQAFRIKTVKSATNSSVSGVHYSGNTARGCTKYGVIIDQSYPSTLGQPGNGVTISDIDFSGSKTNIVVGSDAERVAVNCGSGSCTVSIETGTWDWSELEVSGGKAGNITGFSGITGFSQT